MKYFFNLCLMIIFSLCFLHCGFDSTRQERVHSSHSIKNGRVFDVADIFIEFGLEEPIQVDAKIQSLRQTYKAVGVISTNANSDEAWGVGGCTGTLIGPRTVLTAAHCIRPGQDYYFQIDRRFSIKSRKAIGHPKWYTEGHPYDIGLLLLEERIQDVKPFSLIDQNVTPGSSTRLIGYGSYQNTDAQGNVVESGANGVKRIGNNEITSQSVHNGRIFIYEGQVGCKGDSGGPLFTAGNQGKEIVAGVHSSGGCGPKGWATSVFHFLDWIIDHSEGDVVMPEPSEILNFAPPVSQFQCNICPNGFKYQANQRLIESSLGTFSCEVLRKELQSKMISEPLCSEVRRASAQCCVTTLKKNRCRLGEGRGGASGASNCS